MKVTALAVKPLSNIGTENGAKQSVVILVVRRARVTQLSKAARYLWEGEGIRAEHVEVPPHER